jgi:hypothetical protein
MVVSDKWRPARVGADEEGDIFGLLDEDIDLLLDGDLLIGSCSSADGGVGE